MRKASLSFVLLAFVVLGIFQIVAAQTVEYWRYFCPGTVSTEVVVDGFDAVCYIEEIPSPTPTITPTPSPTPQVQTIIVDHTSIDLFDSIPLEYIQAARNITMSFADRSVGSNINDGLTCLAYPDIVSAPSHCKRPDPETAEFTPSVEYSRNNWEFLIADVYTDYQPYQVYQVTGYMPNYLEFYLGQNTSFDLVFPYSSASFENQIVIFYTSSLARLIGTELSTNFNASVREYINQNGGILIDIADIESHRPDGTECLLGEYPIICETYTTEISGGHLGSVSAGKIRIAKAIWITMAMIVGWNP